MNIQYVTLQYIPMIMFMVGTLWHPTTLQGSAVIWTCDVMDEHAIGNQYYGLIIKH